MPKATTNTGNLVPLEDCFIEAGDFVLNMRILPDVSDSKSAAYNDEPIIGRSFPLKTYSHSENRAISWTAHFIVVQESDIEENIRALRFLESLVYPRGGEGIVAGGGLGGIGGLNGGNPFGDLSAPFQPPPIARIKCGRLLAEEELCVVLKSYSVKFPTEVTWYTDEANRGYIPAKFDVDLSFEVIYDSSDLPGQDRILREGS